MELGNNNLLFLNRNKGINYLIVEEGQGPSEDDSVAQITQKRMDELKLFKSETALLKGRKKKKLIQIILPDNNNLSDNKIRLNATSRRNLGVKIGDIIYISKYHTIPVGDRVKILPLEDSIEEISGNLIQEYLIPYFKDAYRPVTKGEIITIKRFKTVQFKVVECDPEFSVIVGPDTIIFDEGESIKREDEEINEGFGYKDFGGYKNQFLHLIDIIELSLLHTELYFNLGIKHIKGILLYGPHGTGKTLLTRAISNEIDCFTFLLNGNEIISKNLEEAENSLRIAFSEAEKNRPSLIVIDDIDIIAKKKDKIKNEIEMKILSLLIYLMDSLRSNSKIIVIGTTTKIKDIEPDLKTNERFCKEIEIGIPNEEERLEILKIHTEKMKLNEDIDLKRIASLTENFVGSDLVQLCNEAGYQCMIEKLNDIKENDNIGLDKEHINQQFLDSMKITNKNFIFAVEQKKKN